jgi:uncharacterized protein YdbL (DUF1318 family)
MERSMSKLHSAATRRWVVSGLFAILLALPLAAPAFALELDQARASGQIGERPDGLVGAVSPNASAEVKALVDMINKARMDAYRAVAQKEGTALEAVQKVAGDKQLQTAARSGWYVMTANGTWKK